MIKLMNRVDKQTDMSRHFAYMNPHQLMHFSTFHYSSTIIALDSSTYSYCQISCILLEKFSQMAKSKVKFLAGNGLHHKAGIDEVFGKDPQGQPVFLNFT